LGCAYHDLGQFEQAIKFYEDSLAIANKIDNPSGQSYCLLGLGKTRLATGELSEAHQKCTKARSLEVPETNYQAALILGVVLLHQKVLTANESFVDAITRCRTLLDKTANLYEPRYALATALVGKAICNPQWIKVNKRAELLTPALTEYQHALEICDAPGVVQDALRDLELIRATGVEGLEPVFELLEAKLA
jgi:tetratricopeptide (TPR) repeat protein